MHSEECFWQVFGPKKLQVNLESILGWIPLVALMTYVTSFSAGFGPIPWLMMGEIFPGRIRGAAASIATAFNWTCTFIVTKSFMDLQVSLPTNSPLMVGIESTVAGFNLLGGKSENCHFCHFCELQHKVGQKDPNQF